MCGFYVSNIESPIDSLSNILDRHLAFRGPDYQSEIIFINGWQIYHSRLAISDLDSSAQQPIINKDGSFLIFNGEILNFHKLGKKYFNRNYSSDTWLLNDLIVNDALILEELDGFFSFVFVDSNGKLKYAARDSFGVKPLFSYSSGDVIAFCSEPYVLAKNFKCEVSKKSLKEYRLFRYPIISGSYFTEVEQVQPGTCYVSGEYFNAASYFREQEGEFSYDEFKDGIVSGIESRLVSDARIGLLLSKGVDSNLIQNISKIDTLYSAGFPGDDDFEFLKSKDITGLRLCEITPEQFIESFEYLVKIRGEPLSVPNEVLLYILAKKAKDDGVRVLLSGEGADEFFAGYDKIFTWSLGLDEFNIEQFVNLYAYDDLTYESSIYTDLLNIFHNVKDLSAFDQVRWFFIRYHMPVLFRRLDFSLMAAGVEGREPLANMHVFSAAVKARPEQLMYESLGKLPMRKFLSEFMGKEFAFEEKIGFPVDLTKIFKEKELGNYDIWFSKNLELLQWS